jgi:hypothetical protein
MYPQAVLARRGIPVLGLFIYGKIQSAQISQYLLNGGYINMEKNNGRTKH